MEKRVRSCLYLSHGRLPTASDVGDSLSTSTAEREGDIESLYGQTRRTISSLKQNIVSNVTSLSDKLLLIYSSETNGTSVVVKQQLMLWKTVISMENVNIMENNIYED
jgi:hypothetical protein